ncbi:bacterial trigger factor-like protein [Nitzschia inconspicua]|uniref:Bacterial trigger factor-like protein n=1 Tax=Nitzschia inconspicua TaxID=303405 RepID=A0A9K3KZX8_9STRA|nr:bacterial trigger factor-like protein [Nitzschia inconspicua]
MSTFIKQRAFFWLASSLLLIASTSFSPDAFFRSKGIHPHVRNEKHRNPIIVYQSSLLDSGEWKGEVVPEGTIRGCSITPVGNGDSTTTEWIIAIDGVEADLGRFSDALYKQIMQQAKRERFQGFRPGTIPPHLMTTYRAFCMDECARETVLEAMQQNNIRPFTDARSQFVIEQVSIPPPGSDKKKSKKSSKKQKGNTNDVELAVEEEAAPQWRFFDTMDGAIQAGWKPGQSFSFVAKNVKGQNVLPEKDVGGATPIGRQW